MKTHVLSFRSAASFVTCAAVFTMLLSAPSSSQGANVPTPFERSLALWRQGDKAAAIDQFVKIDWNSKPVLSAKSPLAAKEKDLPAMSAVAREKLMGEVMPLLKDLKELGTAVKAKANAAQDVALRKDYLMAVDKCGMALDEPDALKIVQLTAKSLRKMVAPK